jgi:hypothetical protein
MTETHRTHLARAAAVAAFVLLLALTSSYLVRVGHVHALQAAGLNQNSGAVGGIAQFASKLTDNVKWLVGTLIGLAIGVVGLLFAMGHTRAHDLAIKAAIGAGIIVGLGGIIK